MVNGWRAFNEASVAVHNKKDRMECQRECQDDQGCLGFQVQCSPDNVSILISPITKRKIVFKMQIFILLSFLYTINKSKLNWYLRQKVIC